MKEIELSDTSRFCVRYIRSGELALARQLIGVFRRTFEEAGGDLASDEQLRLLLARADFHAVVALDEGAVIGGLTAYELPLFGSPKRELFLYDLAVAPEYQRRGVGRTLIEFARDLCEARGLSALCIPAHTDDEGAVAFYQACGLKREEVAWFVQEFD